MVIIGMMSYPPEAPNEAGKCFMNQKPLAGYITMKGPYVSGTKGEGIQTITIYEFEGSKFADAMEHVMSRYVVYHAVPGLTYSVNVWLEIGEALKMIGLG